jgi:DNA helicase-4
VKEEKKINNLSEEQKNAIFKNNDNNVLLRARAGSGKTSVIVEKINYLVSNNLCKPSEILILAFNKKASEEIKERMEKIFNANYFVNARTFHSLAHKIVEPQKKNIDILFSEDAEEVATAEQHIFIQNLLKDLEDNPNYKKKLLEFFKKEVKEINNIGEFKTKKDFINFRKKKKEISLNNEKVKSDGEKIIADFMFEHDINYSYEKSWNWKSKLKPELTEIDKSYRPDFSLFINHEKNPDIVIEHWGIDEYSKIKETPNNWDKTWQEYKEQMQWKREYWKQYNIENPNKKILFLETSIKDMRNGKDSFIEKLKTIFHNHNISLNKLSDEELFKKIPKERITKFTKMIYQYISKAKKQLKTPQDLKNEIEKFRENSRVYSFLIIANRLYQLYEEKLQKEIKIDFDDLLNIAKQKILTNPDTFIQEDSFICSLKNLKFILIDEYQDFSLLFFEIINAIRKINNNVKIFAVGDDWQSINGFAGADLEYFLNFTEKIKPSIVKELRNNYRSRNKIIELANRFMEGKGNGSIAFDQSNYGSAFKIFLKENKENVLDEIIENLIKLIERYRLENKTMGILSRTKILGKSKKNEGNKEYSFVLKDLKTTLKKEFIKDCKSDDEKKDKKKEFDEKIDIRTLHSSKGLEYDIVVILNVKDRLFPMIHSDSDLYEIFGETRKKIVEEENRLFYVGITRAKEHLYFFTDYRNESLLIEDMGTFSSDTNIKEIDILNYKRIDNPFGRVELTLTGKSNQKRILLEDINLKKIIENKLTQNHKNHFTIEEKPYHFIINIQQVKESYRAKIYFNKNNQVTKHPEIINSSSDNFKDQIEQILFQKLPLNNFDFITDEWRKNIYQDISNKYFWILDIQQGEWFDNIEIIYNNYTFTAKFYYKKIQIFSKIEINSDRYDLLELFEKLKREE